MRFFHLVLHLHFKMDLKPDEKNNWKPPKIYIV